MSTFYGGISKDNKSHVLVINDKDWFWPKSKFLNNTFGHLPIGTKFDITSVTQDNSIEVDWKTLTIYCEYMEDDLITEYVRNDAIGKKHKTLASAKKKMDYERLRGMTLAEISDTMWKLSKTQQQAVMAIVLRELM